MYSKVHTREGSPDRGDFLVGTSVSLHSHHSSCSGSQVSLKPQRIIGFPEEDPRRGELRALPGCEGGTLHFGVARPSCLAGAEPQQTPQFAADCAESGKGSQVSVLLAFKPLCTLRA